MEKKIPEPLHRLMLQILLTVTARAFHQKGKIIWHLPAKKGLSTYALYTMDCAKDPFAQPGRLYATFQALGTFLRRLSGFTEDTDLAELVFFLYRVIGITMEGSLPGGVQVKRCFFSAFYTPQECALMSHMDAGLITGILGRGSFSFTERLTEGCPACRAFLAEKEYRRKK
ncbi:MAG: hypothetical protein IIZ39_02600 [Blautia sp.]|nr:hypothetical protein [Blautia sp.]